MIDNELKKRGFEELRSGLFVRGSVSVDRFDGEDDIDLMHENDKLLCMFNNSCPHYIVLAAVDALVEREEP